MVLPGYIHIPQAVVEAPPALPPPLVDVFPVIRDVGHPEITLTINASMPGSWVHHYDPNAPLGSFENPIPYETRSIQTEGARLLGHIGGLIWKYVVPDSAQTGQTSSDPPISVPGSRSHTSNIQSTSWHAQRIQHQTRDEIPRRQERHVHFREGADSVINHSSDNLEARQTESSVLPHVRPAAPAESSRRKQERQEQETREQLRQSIPLGATPGQNSHRQGPSIHPQEHRDVHQARVSRLPPSTRRPRRRSNNHPEYSHHATSTGSPTHGSSRRPGPMSSHEWRRPPANQPTTDAVVDDAEIWPDCSICQERPAHVSDDGVTFCFTCYGEARAMDTLLLGKDSK